LKKEPKILSKRGIMSYVQLTPESVVDYIKGLQSMQSYFSNMDQLSVQEIGDGNLNFVYNIINEKNPSEAVILKQAVPYVRVIGESYPLSRERMNFEIMALKKQKELCPEHVPDIYYADNDMSLVIMQNLNHHKIIRGEIIQGIQFPNFAEHISTFLSKTLFCTSDLMLGSGEKKEMVAKCINIELCDLTEHFVFTNAFEQHETNDYNPRLTREDIAYIQEDQELKIAVAEMKYKFMNNAECLLHGDLHIGSIMANQEETYVIDPEFAFYGPMGFDIGAVIGNLFMSYFSHEVRQPLLGREPFEYRNWLLNTIRDTWNLFAKKFEQLWVEHQARSDSLYWKYTQGETHFARQRQVFLKRIFADSLGMGACKMMRRIFGLAKVADIADIPDLEQRAKVERMTLKLAKHMVIDREQIESIEFLIETAKKISPLV
jgi:5-methylthioribose kinase